MRVPGSRAEARRPGMESALDPVAEGQEEAQAEEARGGRSAGDVVQGGSARWHSFVHRHANSVTW